MLLHRNKQRTNTLLQDVSRAASRIAEESKSLADVARTELGDLSREVRDQASGTTTKARRATAAKLAGAADAVEPTTRKRRKLPILLSALGGLVVAMKLAKRGSHHADEGELAEQPLATSSDSPTATPATATSPASRSSKPASSTRQPESGESAVGASRGSSNAGNAGK